MPRQSARTLIAAVDSFWFAEAPARRLAALRILTAGFVLVYYPTRAPVLLELHRLHDESFVPVGVLSWMTAPPPSWFTSAALVGCVASAGAAALGWHYRWSGPLLAGFVLLLGTLRSSWGMIFHSENLLFWHLAVLALSKAADAWSLDSGRSEPRFGPAYGWPSKLMLAMTLATYFLAGVAKLRGSGLSWAGGELLLHHVAFNGVRKIELGAGSAGLAAALVPWPQLFSMLASGSLVLEVLAPLAFVHRRALRCWALGAFSFHWAIFLVMAIPFHYPMTGIAFAAFVPIERVLEPGRRWFARGFRSWGQGRKPRDLAEDQAEGRCG